MLDTTSPTRPRFFRGLQSLDVSIDPHGTLAPSENVPGGFDAVAQFDSSLFQRQRDNLVKAGAANLSARVLYSADGFPDALRAAVAPLVRPIDVARVLGDGCRAPDRAAAGAAVASGDWAGRAAGRAGEAGARAGVHDRGDSADRRRGRRAGEGDEQPVEIEWPLELNLLRLFLHAGTLDPTGGARVRANGGEVRRALAVDRSGAVGSMVILMST